ncbi:MAG: hypothetical protein R2861_09890 [Desulfobacterales bacterium]
MEKILDMDHPIHGFETQRYTKDGWLLDVSIMLSRYLDHAGDVTGILLILRYLGYETLSLPYGPSPEKWSLSVRWPVVSPMISIIY